MRSFRKLPKRILSCTLAGFMLTCCIPGTFLDAFAAEQIAVMNGQGYTDFDNLIDDLEDKDGENVTISMSKDWDAAADSDFNERLVVPKNCNLTINMNGHMFNRNLASRKEWESNGEMICLRTGAKLTINGGTSSIPHTVYLHHSTDNDDYASKKATVWGGVLTGGSSTNGAGGIHTETYTTIVLNDVTIAGCRAEEALWSDGEGGGIYLGGETSSYPPPGNSSVTLNNSSIIGCFAYYDGGGIYSDSQKNKIVLNNSHIDNNYANDDGGGVAFNYGDSGCLKGDGKSSVSGNAAGNRGGGLWIDDDTIPISNLTLDDNRAKNGGGIFSNDHTISMTNLKMSGNRAERGGAIYVDRQKNTIANCEITGNSASISGGGVYVGSNVNDTFTVSGTTVIKNNPGSGSNNNLYMSDNDPEDNRVIFSLIKGADVHIGYFDTKNKSEIMISPGKIGDKIKCKDCSHFVTADNSGYYIAFNSAPNARKLLYKKGTKPSAPAPVNVAADNANDASKKNSTGGNKAGVVGVVGAGGVPGYDYDLIRGFYTHEETDNGSDDRTGLFYYSDGLFYSDPATYNDHLATTTWVMAFAGTYLRKFETADANGNIYYNKHAGARQFMADIGCPDQNIYVNDSMVNKPGTDSIGVTIASKELAKTGDVKTGDILIPITVRGGGYEAEWASNVTLGPSGEAEGFARAATNVVAEVDKYIKKYGLEDKVQEGKVKFWVTGFSRAGATANITSKRLIEKYADGSGAAGKNNQVFAYPCEAAKGGVDSAQTLDDEKYFSIHNLINKADVVPLVGSTEMGFKRYGVDHYLPGSTAGTPKKKTVVAKRGGSGGSSITVTTYYDNEQYYTKTENYNNMLNGFRAFYGKSFYEHLESVDPNLIYDDYFHPMAMDFFPSPSMYEEGGYDDNHVEDFLEDFIRIFQEGTDSNSLNHYSQAVSSRKVWAEDVTTINNKSYATIQNAMRDTMSLVFSMDEDNTAGFVERASNITGAIPTIGHSDVTMFEIYRRLIGEWNELDEDDKETYIKFFWDKLKDSGALDYLEKDEVNKLEKNWPTVANMLFRFIDADYNYNPGDNTEVSKWAHGVDEEMTYVPTFATFSTYILMNHYPEVNISWARQNDSWYKDDRNDFVEYNITKPSSVAAPTARVMIPIEGSTEEEEKTLFSSADDPEKNKNKLLGDQKIILENEEIVGEAVYYDLEDITNGENGSKKLETNQIYRGGVDLVLGDALKKTFKITTYDMSYGVKSAKAVYYINVDSGKHPITVKDSEAASKEVTYYYKQGDTVMFAAKSGNKQFAGWTVTDETGTDVTDKVFVGAYEKFRTRVIGALAMPEEGEDGFSEDYALTVTADYRDKITEINALIDAPVGGSRLDDQSTIRFNTISDKTFEYPVVWTYETEDSEGVKRNVTQTGNAYKNTVYTAKVTIPANSSEGIAFADGVKAFVNGQTATIRKYSSDGHVTITFTFPATGDTGEVPPEELIQFNIKAFDLNLKSFDDSVSEVVYARQGETIRLTAPSLDNEVFYMWDEGQSQLFKDTIATDSASRTITVSVPTGLTEQAYNIVADYVPVVNEISINVPSPKGGEVLPDTINTMEVKVSNTYSIDPSCIKLEWTPAPLMDESGMVADYNVPYTATVTLKPIQEGQENAGKIKTSVNGTTKYIDAVFVYADTVSVMVDGNAASLDKEDDSVSYTFPVTKYRMAEDAYSPEDINDIPHGTGRDELLGMLPETVKILVNTGLTLDAEVEWSLTQTDGQGDARNASTWKAEGRVKLPDNVENPEGYYSETVSMNLKVDEADYAASPSSSLPSGEYLGDQIMSLSTDTEGGKIYYTLDGSDPTVSATRKEYDGETILLSKDAASPDDAKIIVKAYSTKDGLWDSNVSTYTYTFTNEVPVPGGVDSVYNGEPKVGVSGGAFYTLMPGKGVTIDKDGNAVATEVGTYTVTAKISEGYVWKNPDEDAEYDEAFATGDKIITFKITPPESSDEEDNKDKEDENALYFAISGDGNEWTKGSGVSCDFRFKRSTEDEETFNRFKGIMVDGEKVENSNYVKESGSVILKLNPEYMETLKTGDHTLTAVFEDGSAKASFKVLPAGSKNGGNGNKSDGSNGTSGVKTGDAANLLFWEILAGLSLFAAVLIILLRRRYRRV